MKNKIYLLEPHQHVEVLYRWVKCLQKSSFEWEVLTSKENYKALCILIKDIPIQFSEFKMSAPLPNDGVILICSLQNKWYKWQKKLVGKTFLLCIHNINCFFSKGDFVSVNQTAYTKTKYLVKKWKSKYVDQIYKNRLLKATYGILPFAHHLEIPRYTEKQMQYPVIQQEKMKGNLVVIPLYKHHLKIHNSFLQSRLLDYKKNGLSITILSDRKPKELAIADKTIKWLKYPCTYDDYYNLLKETEVFCFPYEAETHFDVFQEIVGKTKYSARLRDALEFSCTIDAPSSIALESPQALQTPKEYAQLFEERLNSLGLS